MSIKIPSGKTRLLLVEGADDKEFFIQLGKHLEFTNSTPLWIMMYEGKDNLSDFLALIQADAPFLTITHIGIVRDADFDGRAFQHIQNAIRNANQENLDRLQYPEITQPEVFFGRQLKVGVFIMPNHITNGMLENLILEGLADDEIMKCVDSYFDCLGKNEIILQDEPFPKAKMRVYMTALFQEKMRAYIEGRNVDIHSTGSDRNKSYLSDIYRMSWWDWNHSAFDDIKSFINQIVDLSS